MAQGVFRRAGVDQAGSGLIGVAMGRTFPDCSSMVSNELSSAKVALKRLAGARVIWLNKAAPEVDDPSPASREREALRRARLIESCAYLVSDRRTVTAHGWADRYGGSGIGTNGGSGRSVVLDGYSVKGVGPTPLIGVGTPLAHSSGGAYLEEAIREILFSRLLQRIMPHGASPIVAVIDTGIDQQWHLEGGIKTERRVLIVRRFALRPAHFQRAYRYRPAGYEGKRADIARVAHNFRTFSGLFAAAGLRQRLEDCYGRWAEQLAFALVHNVALGPSPSNVTLEGEVMDFGACSTLPVSANYFISPGNSVVGDFGRLLGSLDEVALSATSFDADMFHDFGATVEAKAVEAYERTLVSEVLNAVGLGNRYKSIEKSASARADVLKSFLSYRRDATRLRLDLLASQYQLRFRAVPGLEAIWSADRPASLDPLATALQMHFGCTGRGVSSVFKPWSVTRESLREEITDYIEKAGSITDLDEVISHFGQGFD
ncbi:MAG TPA: hypothetical protein VFZ91_03985 [Allosphingosinicella sp.]